MVKYVEYGRWLLFKKAGVFHSMEPLSDPSLIFDLAGSVEEEEA